MSPIATPALPADVIDTLRDALTRARKAQSDGASFLSNATQEVKHIEAVLATYGIEP